jgi:alpha/beta superfamily hydrolase
MKEDHVTFPCGKLTLEGIYFKAQPGGPVPAVVVCHPHPLYGGSMHNNVTYTIARALVSKNIAALLFNFRGVGSSSGAFSGGTGEQDDVRAALDYLQSLEGIDGKKLGLAGYSFGGGIVLPVACSDERVSAFALISPYSENKQDDMLGKCAKPKLIMGGSMDDLVSPDEVQLCASIAAGPKKVEIVGGADHFWGGYEDRMAWLTAAFFSDSFK